MRADNTSKLALTAVCEQLSLELQRMGGDAAHVSSHSLHPALAATNFLLAKTLEDGEVVAGGGVALPPTPACFNLGVLPAQFNVILSYMCPFCFKFF